MVETRRPRNIRRHRFATLLAVIFSVVVGSTVRAGTLPDPAIIDDGSVALGVNLGAALNVGAPIIKLGTEGANPGIYGLRDIATGYEGLSGGDPYEGWGIADMVTGFLGGATSFGPTNLSFVDYQVSGAGTLPGVSSGNRVVSVLDVDLAIEIPIPTTLLRITHDFHPSIVPGLYEVEVTVENTYTQPISPRYRRLLDWDIQPDKFNEYVSVVTGPSTAVIDPCVTNPGSLSPNPTVPNCGIVGTESQATPEGAPCFNGTDFIHCGPADLGASFDLQFPVIPVGGHLRFWLYYGTATDETAALGKLGAVGASAYSFGQSQTNGEPVTFILGFKAPWAIIDNGVVELGVDMFGALNVHGGIPSAGSVAGPSPEGFGPPVTGLRPLGSNLESLAGGTPWEGWGVADIDTDTGAGSVSGIALAIPLMKTPEGGPVANAPVGVNMMPEDFDVSGVGTASGSVGKRAIVKSLVGDPPLLRVTHDYRPAKAPGLYEVVVILENLSGSTVTPRYRRLADWNIEPTAGFEVVTIAYTKGDPVVHSTGLGRFNSPNPLDEYNYVDCDLDAPFVDCGPDDLGMAIDFALDPIPPGGEEQFLLYYGAGMDESAALIALAAVHADVYALAESAPFTSPEAIFTAAFAFGFRDVLFVDDFETSDTTRWSTTVPAP